MHLSGGQCRKRGVEHFDDLGESSARTRTVTSLRATTSPRAFAFARTGRDGRVDRAAAARRDGDVVTAARRWRVIGNPIAPSPTKPIFMFLPVLSEGS